MTIKTKNRKKTIAAKIKAALGYKGVTQSFIADQMGMSRSSFHQKMVRDTFEVDEVVEIARIINAQFSFNFEFEDGTKI